MLSESSFKKYLRQSLNKLCGKDLCGVLRVFSRFFRVRVESGAVRSCFEGIKAGVCGKIGLGRGCSEFGLGSGLDLSCIVSVEACKRLSSSRHQDDPSISLV